MPRAASRSRARVALHASALAAACIVFPLAAFGGAQETPYRDACILAWDAEAAASGVQLRLSRIDAIAEKSVASAEWSFDILLNNNSKNPAPLAFSFAKVWPGLEAVEPRVPAASSGVLQLGVANREGRLRILETPAGASWLVARAAIRNQSETRYMRVECIDDAGTTQLLAKASVGAEMLDYAFKLDESVAGCELALRSSNKDFPLLLESVRLLSSYEPAHSETNLVAEVQLAPRRRTWTARRLAPGDYIWTYRAGEGEWAAARAFEISPGLPRLPEIFKISLR